MGDTKKIDIPALSALCRKWLPAFESLRAMYETDIFLGIYNEEREFVRFYDIQVDSKFSPGGTHKILKTAQDLGMVEKMQNAPKYRITPLWEKVGDAAAKITPYDGAEIPIRFISKNAAILSVMQQGPRSVGGMCKALNTPQPTMSLQLKRLKDAGFLDRRQDGKEVWYSLSDYARQVMPVVEAELRGLE